MQLPVCYIWGQLIVKRSISRRICYFYSVTMILRNLLVFTTVLLIIGWLLGYFVWPHEGHTIHLLLVLAVICLVLAITRKPAKDTID